MVTVYVHWRGDGRYWWGGSGEGFDVRIVNINRSPFYRYKPRLFLRSR